MKNILFVLLLFCGNLYSQKTHSVTINLKYKNKPLCNFTVSIYKGKEKVASAISNDVGIVFFKNINFKLKKISLEGIKLENNVSKKWVINSINLDKNLITTINFEDQIKKLGLNEAETVVNWGLNSLDCISEKKEVVKKEEEKIFTSLQIAKMNDSILESMKVNMNGRIANKKAFLKTNSGAITVEEKNKHLSDISVLENQIGMMDVELSNRKIQLEMQEIDQPKINFDEQKVPIQTTPLPEEKKN